jgi:hypothetical protein
LVIVLINLDIALIHNCWVQIQRRSNNNMGQNYSIDPTIPESQIIRCPVIYQKECCSKSVAEFDTSGAKNHLGLLNLIGEGQGSGASKIDQKFDELAMKLEDFTIANPCLRVIVIIVLWIALVNLLLICGMCYKSNTFDKMIQSHFEDWRELGIQIKYLGGGQGQYNAKYGAGGGIGRRRDKSREHVLVFLLPISMS